MEKPKSAQKFTFKLIIPSVSKITKPASAKKEELINPLPVLDDLSEEETSTLKIMIEKLWAKFVVFFDLEDTFKYDPIYRSDDSVRKCKQTDTTFENRFNIYLQIYKIKKNENQILVSYNKEGSFILKHSKIWIIHLKLLINNYKYSLIDLIPLINVAINNGCEAKYIFDFFIMEMLKLEEEDVKLIKDKIENEEDSNNSFPVEFKKLWKKRKDDIKEKIQKSNEKKQREKTPFKASNIDSVIEEEEFSFRMNTKDKEEDKENNKALNKANTVKKKKNEFHKKFDYERDLKDAKLVSNEKIEKVKNYKVLELNPKVQDNVGLKYIITPVKEKPPRNEVNKDLKVLDETLGDYYYQPYKKEIISKIENNIIPSKTQNKKEDK